MKKIIVVTAAIILATALILVFKKENGPAIDINDPNLIYVKMSWSGLCNIPGAGLNCFFDTYLYRSGELIAKNGYPSAGGKISLSVVEKQLSEIQLEKVIAEIKNSNILSKECVAGIIFDYSANYFLNIDGVKKEIAFPGCREEMNKIESLIWSDLHLSRSPWSGRLQLSPKP